MNLSPKTNKIYSEISKEGTKLGDLRTIAKEIKKDHQIATGLWSTGKLFPRLLAILIMDKNQLNAVVIDDLVSDMQSHPLDDRTQIADWLMANQLTRDKKLIGLMETWKDDSSPIHRRLYWYHQARLRWTGQKPPPNTMELLSEIEEKMLNEEPEVQWAMNFTVAWIGIFDKPYRKRCIEIGEKLGLYKEIVAKNCSPNYLPKFIALEAAKRNM